MSLKTLKKTLSMMTLKRNLLQSLLKKTWTLSKKTSAKFEELPVHKKQLFKTESNKKNIFLKSTTIEIVAAFITVFIK